MCSFPHFSPTCFDILSWNFAHDFHLMYYRSSLSVVTLRQFLLYAPLQTGRIMVWWCPSRSPSVRLSVRPVSVRVSVRPFSALFSYMLWHIELKFCTRLCFNVLQSKFECRPFASIFIRPSSDGTYYGMVMSVRPGLRPSDSPSVHPSVQVSVRKFSTLFSNMLWHIELKFYT